MPIHGWNDLYPGLFHDFHQHWTCEITNYLNEHLLPDGFYAMIAGPAPDLEVVDQKAKRIEAARGGTVIAAAESQSAIAAESDLYAYLANRVVVKHQSGRTVAAMEILSAGEKISDDAFDSFIRRAIGLLRNQINLLIVDLFPPSSRDPQGIHKAIWDEIEEEPFELPADKPLTVAAYSAAPPPMAYVEPVAVGDELASLPIFLERGIYVPAPLESTYQLTWSKCPLPVRELVES